jgi:hypothetical protein
VDGAGGVGVGVDAGGVACLVVLVVLVEVDEVVDGAGFGVSVGVLVVFGSSELEAEGVSGLAVTGLCCSSWL